MTDRDKINNLLLEVQEIVKAHGGTFYMTSDCFTIEKEHQEFHDMSFRMTLPDNTNIYFEGLWE